MVKKKILTNKQKKIAKKQFKVISRKRNNRGLLPSSCFKWNKKTGTKWVWDKKSNSYVQLLNPHIHFRNLAKKYRVYIKNEAQIEKERQYTKANWRRHNKRTV